MTQATLLRALLATGLVATAPMAMAHSGHAESGLLAGFLHPFMGLDHLIVMLAIGLWGANLGGKAVFTVPMAFVATMVLGCVLTVMGLNLPFVEQGIVLSVIFLGLLLLAAAKFSTPLCGLLVASFAFFHGAAHAIEMPLEVHGYLYVIGFTSACVLLHGMGIALNRALLGLNTLLISRITGAVIALTGLGMALA